MEKEVIVESIDVYTPDYKIYIKIDLNKVITEINSSIFIKDLTGWIEIDEGVGDKYSHAQSQYLEKDLVDNQGRYNYKYDAVLVELTEEEKNILFPPIESQPTEIDILKEKNVILEKALLEMAEVQSNEYENRTILENAVLDLANTIAGGK